MATTAVAALLALASSLCVAIGDVLRTRADASATRNTLAAGFPERPSATGVAAPRLTGSQRCPQGFLRLMP